MSLSAEMYPIGVESLSNILGIVKSSVDLCKAIRDAPANQRKAGELLESFDTALSKLENATQNDMNLARQIRSARASWQTFADFLHSFEHRPPGHGDHRARRVFQKTKWAIEELDGKIKTMVDEIGSCLQALNTTLLSDTRFVMWYCATICALNNKRARNDIHVLGKRFESVEASIGSLTPSTAACQSLQSTSDRPQTVALPCWLRKGGCGCQCHESPVISPQQWRHIFVKLHGSLLPKQECDLLCNSQRHGVSARIAFTWMGRPIAFNVAIEFDLQNLVSNPWPVLSLQRVQYPRRYTAPAYVKYEEYFFGPSVPYLASYSSEHYRALLRDADLQCLADIKQLFASGQAHPLDVDPAGVTWLEKLLERPWTQRGYDAQWELLEFIAQRSPEIHTNGKLLWLCATWIGEGPHMSMFETLLESGLDPGNLNVELLRSWPAMSSPNWLAEEYVEDPFFVVFLRHCLRIEPGFADCDNLFEAVLVAEDAAFERALASSEMVSGRVLMLKNTFGQAPVHCAAVQSPRRLQRLLEEGADPDARDEEGTTALMYAATYGCYKSVSILLRHGANPYIRDRRNRRCFWDYAIRRNHWHILENFVNYLREISQAAIALRVLDAGIKYYLINGTDCRDGKSLQRLFDLGADPDVTYDDGSTLIHHSMSADEIWTMLRAGYTNVHGTNTDGTTALLSALGNPQAMDTVIELLLLGSDPNTQDVLGWSALHHACRLADKIPTCFCDSDDLDSRQDKCQKKLSSTALMGILLENGADITIRDHCKCACSRGGCSAMVIALHRLGNNGWAVRTELSYAPMELLSACYFRKHDMTSLSQEVHRYRMFEESGLTHTCCHGISCNEAWRLHFDKSNSTSVVHEHQAFEAIAGPVQLADSSSHENQMLLELAKLYLTIEDRFLAEQPTFLKATNVEPIIKLPQAEAVFKSPLIVDYARDKIKYRPRYFDLSSLHKASGFEGARCQTFLDACLEYNGCSTPKGSVLKTIDFQKQALSKIQVHLESLRNQRAITQEAVLES